MRRFKLHPRMRIDRRRLGIWLAVLIITILGAAIRLYPISRDDFPVNDGGMFYVMVRDLQASHYALPQFTSYNHLNIPYAYPPLPFYLAGLLEDGLGIPLLTLLRFLPAFFCILMIPAFYGLSRQILDSDFQSVHATLAFAIVSPAFEWLIMGGGLTRAPGMLFSILALFQFTAALETSKRLPLVLATLFTALAGYCHIEILWATVVYMTFTTVILARNRPGLYKLVITILVAIVLLSPYIVAVLMMHSVQPFVAALQAGDLGWFGWAGSIGKLLISNLTQEVLITPVLVFSLLGLGLSFQHHAYLLPAWILAAMISDPRSLERTVIIPICLLAGLAIDKIILPGLADLFNPKKSLSKTDNQAKVFPTSIGAIFVIFMLSRTAVIGTLQMGKSDSLDILSYADRRAMQWINRNTPDNSQFLVLTQHTRWQTNERSEWFPALANRNSVTTVQGTEWLPGKQFNIRQEIYNAFQECALKEDLICIDEANDRYGLHFTHIYLSGRIKDSGSEAEFPMPIYTALKHSSQYNVLYDQNGILILAR